MNGQKILIIQTAFLGDAFLTLPMIQELSKKNPNSVIDVIAIPSTSEIFDASPFVNKVIVMDKRLKHKSFFNLIKFCKSIKNENYDIIYSPHRSIRSSLIVMLSGVKETFGFDISAISFVYKNKIKYLSNVHEVERNLRLIGFTINGDNWKIKPEITIDTNIQKKIERLLPNTTSEKIAIAPGSVWQTKKYPSEHFEKLVEYFVEKNYFVLLIGGNEDKILCETIAHKFINKSQSFAGSLSIIESVEILKHCSLIICNDSAPTHMAMAAGIPAATIYCSTIPAFGFYPYNNKSIFISYDELKCKPCGIHGYQKCPVNTFDCGYKLRPEVVFSKIVKLLG